MGLFGVDFTAFITGIKRRLATGPDPTPQEVQEKYLQAAAMLVGELLVACRANDTGKGGAIAQFIHDSNDINLLRMTLGTLAATVVSHERSNPQNLRGMSLDDLNMLAVQQDEPWVTSAMDQLTAAAENSDYRAFAEIAVDSHVKAIQRDTSIYGEAIDFNYVQQAMSIIDQQTLSIITAASLLRLVNADERE